MRGAGVELEIKAPKRVRGGIFYEMRFEIAAERELRRPCSCSAAAGSRASPSTRSRPGRSARPAANGDVSFQLGRVPAGNRHILWLQAQVNPTTVAGAT